MTSLKERTIRKDLPLHGGAQWFFDKIGMIAVNYFTDEAGNCQTTEDHFNITRHGVDVFDGQTSLVGNNKGKNGETGGFIASLAARNIFRRLFNISLREVFETANKEILKQMNDNKVDISDKLARWSTSAASVRFQEEQIICARVGDSVIVVEYNDGRIELALPYIEHDVETLIAWRNLAREWIQEGKEFTDRDLRYHTQIVALIEKVRRNTNINHGFLNGEDNAMNFYNEFTILRRDIRSMLVISDGYFLPRENPENPVDWKQMFTIYHETGLKGLVKHIRYLEKSDPTLTKYPRFKNHDDGTIIALDFRTETEYRQLNPRGKIISEI